MLDGQIIIQGEPCGAQTPYRGHTVMIMCHSTLSLESAFRKYSERLRCQQGYVVQAYQMIRMLGREGVQGIKGIGHHLPLGFIAQDIKRAGTKM